MKLPDHSKFQLIYQEGDSHKACNQVGFKIEAVKLVLDLNHGASARLCTFKYCILCMTWKIMLKKFGPDKKKNISHINIMTRLRLPFQ